MDWLTAGSSIVGGLGKMFGGGSKMTPSSATSSGYGVADGSGWTVTTGGSRSSEPGGLPAYVWVAAGLVALLIAKRA